MTTPADPGASRPAHSAAVDPIVAPATGSPPPFSLIALARAIARDMAREDDAAEALEAQLRAV